MNTASPRTSIGPHPFVTTGLDPVVHAAFRQSSTCNVTPKIDPFGVHGRNQIKLPASRPVLDILFPLYREWHGRILLMVDEALHPVLFAESVDKSLTMLSDPSNKIARYTDIQSAVWLRCEGVYPTAHEYNEAQHGLPGQAR